MLILSKTFGFRGDLLGTKDTTEVRQREGGVQSVERALDILEFVSRSEGELGVSEIGTATGLSAGTAHRLLATLGSRGYVHRNKDTRRYTLGLKSLAMATVTRERVGATSRPFLEELAQVSQETANLTILEGNSAMYIEQATPPTRMLRIFTEPGNRVSLHACGSGKVLLAYQPPRLLDLLVERLDPVRYTASTITDPGQLRSELQQIRRQGYAVDYGEQEDGVRCIAAPVFGADGEIFAAMSISGPSSRLEGQRSESLIPDLKRISKALTGKLDAS